MAKRHDLSLRKGRRATDRYLAVLLALVALLLCGTTYGQGQCGPSGCGVGIGAGVTGPYGGRIGLDVGIGVGGWQAPSRQSPIVAPPRRQQTSEPQSSIVRIDTKLCNGELSVFTGTIVAFGPGRAYVVTIAHFDEHDVGLASATITVPKFGRFTATLAGKNHRVDVAVFVIAAKEGMIRCRIAERVPPVGSTVWLGGYGIRAEHFRWWRGRLCGPYTNEWVSWGAPTELGDSGGPVIDESGCFIGMISAFDNTGRTSAWSGQPAVGATIDQIRGAIGPWIPTWDAAPSPTPTPPVPTPAAPLPLPGPITAAEPEADLAAINARLTVLETTVADLRCDPDDLVPVIRSEVTREVTTRLSSIERIAGPAGPAGPKGDKGEPGDDATVDLDALSAAVVAKLGRVRIQTVDTDGKVIQEASAPLGKPVRLRLKPVPSGG